MACHALLTVTGPTLACPTNRDGSASYTFALHPPPMFLISGSGWVVGMHEVVQLWGVSRIYGTGSHAVTALDNVTAGFARGTFTAVMGPSGSGKSTLLQCAAGLDRPSDGKIILADTDLGSLSEHRLTVLRRSRVGFVFQSFNLIQALTAEQNLALPLRLAGQRTRPAQIHAALAEVGLTDRARHRPSELSGGQQQRVAIARALVTQPDVVFADEPTGALDTKTSRDVLGILRGIVDRHRQTVVMVTHDPVAAAFADRVIFLADGRVAGEARPGRSDHEAAASMIATRMAHLEA
jgi:putative ABC transport system ATP-binding protein